MKKLLFAAYSLEMGGIEIALVNLINNLINKYEITLVLEKKQGVFLKELDYRIKIINYKPNQNKNQIIRKTINLVKRSIFIIKYKNKFDFAGSFATYSKMGSFCARIASKNNALWLHSNYLKIYKKEKEFKDFFNFINYDKFKKLIFVSNNAKEAFLNIYKEKSNCTVVINNLIDYKKIIDKSEEKIEFEKDKIKTFLNVARHDENSKKITRLIDTAEKLKENNYLFRILLIGQGKDTELYKKLVKNKKLEKEVIFLGEKENPYPYFKISDAFVLTSDYEGYPVVFNEAKILNLPIITTDVSDAMLDVKDKYGIVLNKDINSLYIGFKNFIEKSFIIKNKFNYQEFNNEILNKLEEIFKGV